MKPRLLFLAHRIPYPPNKGDKLRSFSLLRHLSRAFSVSLGAFVDDADDWGHGAALEDWCAERFLQPLHPWLGKIKSAKGLITQEALTLPYYRHRAMQRWVDRKVEEDGIQHILVYSSAMAQYVVHHLPRMSRAVIDFVDVDSEKWRDYACHRPWPWSWLYRREARQLLHFDREVAARFDAGVFVSAAERELFATRAPEVAGRLTHIPNGVDVSHFSPGRAYENPYRQEGPVLVFTGAMDYWPNVDAVRWFAREVFPLVQSQLPDARFAIVGARPTNAVAALDALPGVHVVGAVPDIRPYLAHAHAAVAPLRVARGVQNKVLEAMAMAKPVVATPAAMAGIEHAECFRGVTREQSGPFADCVVQILRNGDPDGLGEAGRALMTERYTWQRGLRQFEQLLGAPARPADKGAGQLGAHPVANTA